MNLETRDFELRLEDAEERTVTGLAVPYGEGADIGGKYIERFVPGAIENVDDVKLFWNHEQIIGHVIEGRETEAGYEIVGKIAPTSLGNDVLELPLLKSETNRLSLKSKKPLPPKVSLLCLKTSNSTFAQSRTR